jgi:hypothetical protein
MVLPWKATPGHPVLAAIQLIRALYEHDARELPTTTAIDLGRVWRAVLSGADREQVFRSRERLFIPLERWAKERNSY